MEVITTEVELSRIIIMQEIVQITVLLKELLVIKERQYLIIDKDYLQVRVSPII